MMQQYFAIKEQYPGAILFFRLGDFYEMFFEDAKVASAELDLVLTGRDCGQEERAPMCGVPYHSCEGYIQKLIDNGHKVAICEQMENPALAKGIVRRDVIRVITPGTIIEGSMLDESRNNYLACIYVQDKLAGVCFTDVSTGEMHATELSAESPKKLFHKIANELGRFMPREVLLSQSIVESEELRLFLRERMDCTADMLAPEKFESGTCQALILKQFQKQDLEALGLHEHGQIVAAVGASLQYLYDTQKKDLSNIRELDIYSDNQYMHLDHLARRNLELTETMRNKTQKGALLGVLDKTRTAMGKRLMRSWVEQPLLGIAQITKRQNAVDELYHNTMMLEQSREAFGRIHDLERMMTRIVYGTVSPREMVALAYTITFLPGIRQAIAGASSNMLREVHSFIDELPDVVALIQAALVEEPPLTLKEGGVIRRGYHEELDALQDILHNGKGFLAEMEQQEQQRTGIKKLRIKYNRVFGYFIEVTNSFKDAVPEDYIRKQTLTNCERYITQELKLLEEKVLSAREKSIALEYELFHELRKQIAEQIHRIQYTAHSIARLDVLCSLAHVARRNQYVRPALTVDGTIRIKEGRHPVVEQLLKGAPFVPNDTHLDGKDHQVAIITGPNMAGKSTYMRQVALITLLAQMGSFVPAASASIGIVDGIFTRVGASDDLASGQSTFMVEMNEVAHILSHATAKSLIIFDEIGRGTSTFDGMSIASSVLEYTANKKKLGAKTLFATHYHELTDLEHSIAGVKNYNIAVKKRGDDIIFLRKIVHGPADDSYGIEVAKLSGIPESVIARAKQILASLEEGESAFKTKKTDRRESVPEMQMSFASRTHEVVMDKLKKLDVNTLTPIESMNLLFELVKMAGEPL